MPLDSRGGIDTAHKLKDLWREEEGCQTKTRRQNRVAMRLCACSVCSDDYITSDGIFDNYLSVLTSLATCIWQCLRRTRLEKERKSRSGSACMLPEVVGSSSSWRNFETDGSNLIQRMRTFACIYWYRAYRNDILMKNENYMKVTLYNRLWCASVYAYNVKLIGGWHFRGQAECFTVLYIIGILYFRVFV